LPEQVALVIGSEPAGVDPAILQIADQVLYIPMAEKKNSLNVSVAFGIAIYRLLGL
jgi:TrmH family RNA methyltransferase